MFKLIGKIPNGEFGVACSGGVDSMAVLDFILKGGRKPNVLYFNHNTEHGKEAELFVKKYCEEHGLNFISKKTNMVPTANKEKIWSDLRYNFFSNFNYPIIMSHHLDDCVETYIFSAFRGFLSTIPYRRGNVIRPFLLNEKKLFEEWCSDKNVPFIQDESNYDVNFSRNRIRHNIVPEALKVNPGLKTIVKKKIMESL